MTAAAWRDGGLSGGQVDVILATLTKATLPLFAEDESRVVARLADSSMEETAAVLRDWQEAAINRVEDPLPPESSQSLHLSQTFGGHWALDADLDTESGETLAVALRLATSPDVDGEPIRRPAQRRADALVDIARFFLDHQHGVNGGRHRPHLNVVMDVHGDAGTFVDGGVLDGSAVQALACDSIIHRVLMDGPSAIIDYGRATRTIPAPLWNGLVVLDEHCRFPGCDRPAVWCDGHHVWAWEHGGPTNPGNLVLLCRRHHRRLHRKGWSAKLLPDRTFEVTDPDGIVRTSRPPRAAAALFDATTARC